MKVSLTREQAILEHRKMWNWIAKKTLDTGKKASKIEYFIMNNIDSSNLQCNCYLCDYAHAIYGNLDYKHYTCEHCPLDWGETVRCNDDNGLYKRWLATNNSVEAALLARKIANLPEK